MSTRSPNIPGALMDANAPIIALLECPTNTAFWMFSSSPHFNQVLSIPVRGGVFVGREGGQIRTARSHVIEQDRRKFALEGGRNESLHPLIAAEAVRKDHGALAHAPNPDIIPVQS